MGRYGSRPGPAHRRYRRWQRQNKDRDVFGQPLDHHDHSQHNKQYIKQLGHDDADNSAAINGSPGAGYYGSTVTRSL